MWRRVELFLNLFLLLTSRTTEWGLISSRTGRPKSVTNDISTDDGSKFVTTHVRLTEMFILGSRSKSVINNISLIELHESVCREASICFGDSNQMIPRDRQYTKETADDHTLASNHWRLQNSACCKSCWCDKDCGKRGDCCTDRLNKLKLANTECLRNQIAERPKQRFPTGFYMIANCSHDYSNQEVIHRCQTVNMSEIESMRTVHSNRTKIIYKNADCAFCNGVDDVINWLPGVFCGPDVAFINMPTSAAGMLASIKDHPECSVVFNPPEFSDFTNALCYPESVNKCNITGLWESYDPRIEEACASLKAYVVTEQMSYKNSFCFICNRRSNSVVGCVKNFNPVSLTTLFNFHDDKISRSIEAPKSDKCDENHFFDRKRGICRELLCPAGQRRKNNICVTIIETSEGKNIVQLTVNLQISPFLKSGPKLIDIIRRESRYFISLPKSILNSVVGGNIMPCSLAIYAKSSTSGLESLFGILKIQIINVNAQVWQKSLEVVHLNLKQGLPLSLGFGREFFINVSFSKFYPITFVTKHAFPDPIQGGIYTELGGVPLNGSERCEWTKIAFNLKVISFCDNVLLFPDEYTVFDTYVKIQRNGRILHNAEYEFVNTENDDVMLRVCHSLVFERENQQSFDKRHLSLPDILSFVFSVLSILCLLLVVVVYAAFKVLRTKPGLNTMFLALNLAIAQGVYIVGIGENNNQYFCKIVGILIHFCWLSVTGWTFVSCVYVFSVFHNVHAITKFKPRNWILGSLILCNATAAIFISSNIVFMLMKTGFQDIGYGGDLCYINSNLMRAFTFALPLGIVVVANTCLFLAVVLKIHRSKLNPQVLNVERSYLGVYVRLSTLTGVTWMLGFLYEWTRMDALEYMFVVLHGGHGVMLMVSFVFTPGVRRAFRSRCIGTDDEEQ